MLKRNSVASIVLLLAFGLIPPGSGAESRAAIEMNNSETVEKTALSTATSLSVPSVTASGAGEASSASWWDGFTKMLGLKDSDPGLTGNPLASHKALATKDYIIGPGDVIGISVWRDENLTRSVVVLPDGKITFPLLGDLVAGGKTVAQLKKELEAGLTRYTADSSVTVEVKQSNSMIIYIIGRVNGPGRQALVATTNVLQALAMAGGPNPYAKKSAIRIFRQEDGTTNMFLFNYDEVAEGRHLEMNIELKRGDVIIVP